MSRTSSHRVVILGGGFGGLLGEAVDVDTKGRRVILSDGEVPYDMLIVATGVRHDYFGQDAWEKDAPGLKTIEEATETNTVTWGRSARLITGVASS